MENLHVRLNDTKDVITNMSDSDKLKTLNTCIEIFTLWDISKLDQSILLSSFNTNRTTYWKLNWIESQDDNAVLRAHYIIKIYILLKLLYPEKHQQLTWLKTVQKELNHFSPSLLMMQENNAYFLLILETLNQQLKQRVNELTH
ncbi:hypothetical protein [Thalassomonas sp. M1454]|uniref:hypothetical protein n=1 Tax=Thalassomonas sp. M1454 TaxID=2594477 RepID=UPI001180D74F|nr:hypothetical protein [Thalassomonas sp. M1454]TRX57182.1 hypothetical protein FNN08_06700 [Thalassomonas sp. M1454]